MWVVATPDAEDGAKWVPAEAPLRALRAMAHHPGHPLAHDKLSFMGFRGRDGAPVFCADVTGAEDTVRAAIETHMHSYGNGANDAAAAAAAAAAVAVAAAAAEGAGSTAGGVATTTTVAAATVTIAVRNTKSVSPDMRRDDAGLVVAAAGLLKWQSRTKFCAKCGHPNKLVKAGHKAGGALHSTHQFMHLSTLNEST